METPVFKFQMSYAYAYAKKNIYIIQITVHTWFLSIRVEFRRWRIGFINKSRIQEIGYRVYQ